MRRRWLVTSSVAMTLALFAAIAPVRAEASDPPTHRITGTVSGGPRTTTFSIAARAAFLQTIYVDVPPGPFSVEVPDGEYQVSFNDEQNHGSVGESYDNVTSGAATPVVVDGADVDLGDISLTPLTDVHGSVSIPESVEGVGRLEAYPSDGASGVVRHGLFSGHTWHLYLEPGDWKIRFVEGDWGPFPSFWLGGTNGTNSAATASVFHVAGADLDLGVQQVAIGTISGHVRTDLGEPVRKVTVTATDPDGHQYRTSWSKDSGLFTLPFLAPGPYTVEVSDELGDLVATTYYPASPLAAGAVPITVPADGVVDERDVVVPRPMVGTPLGTDVAGRVTDSNGQPIQGLGVFSVSGCLSSQLWQSWSYAVTDADGRYALRHAFGDAAVSGVRLAFSDDLHRDVVSHGGPEGHDYITTFSGGASECDDATEVPLGTMDADATLVQYGGLSGSIASVEGHDELDGDVYAFADAPTQPPPGTYDHPAYRYHWRLDEPRTTFSSPRIAPGRYRLLFVAQDGGLEHGAAWWPQGTDWASAAVVDVRPGEMTTGLDAALTDRPVLTSPLSVTGTSRVGEVLQGRSGIWVSPWSLSYEPVWLRDRVVVGTGWTYRPSPSDVGHTLRFRVTAHGGGEVGVATTAETAPVAAADPGTPPPGPDPHPDPTTPPSAPGPSAGPTAPSVRAKARLRPVVAGRPAAVVIDVRVASAGSPATGTITVTEGRRTRAVVTLVGGRALVHIRRVDHRRHRFRILYSGSTTVLPGSEVVVVDAR